MLQLSIEIGDSAGLVDYLKSVKKRSSDFTPVMTTFLRRQLKNAAARIRAGGDPPWKPSEYHLNHPLLQRTGRLLNSLSNYNNVTVTDNNSAQATIPVPYAPYQQFGYSKLRTFASGGRLGKLRRVAAGGGLPARPFFYITEKDVDTAVAEAGNFILWGTTVYEI